MRKIRPMSGRPRDKPPTTSITLVGRLRDPADAEAWREFDLRYRDLIVRFLRGRGLQLADAEDSAQAVLAKLVSGLRSFEYDASKGGFRAYLYKCARSALCDHISRQGRGPGAVSLREVQDSPGTEDDDAVFAEFEREWVDHHYRIAVARLHGSLAGRDLVLFDALLAGRATRAFAEENGMTENALHKAEQRLRARLRALIDEQIRDEEAGDVRPDA